MRSFFISGEKINQGRRRKTPAQKDILRNRRCGNSVFHSSRQDTIPLRPTPPRLNAGSFPVPPLFRRPHLQSGGRRNLRGVQAVRAKIGAALLVGDDESHMCRQCSQIVPASKRTEAFRKIMPNQTGFRHFSLCDFTHGFGKIHAGNLIPCFIKTSVRAAVPKPASSSFSGEGRCCLKNGFQHFVVSSERIGFFLRTFPHTFIICGSPLVKAIFVEQKSSSSQAEHAAGKRPRLMKTSRPTLGNQSLE